MTGRTVRSRSSFLKRNDVRRASRAKERPSSVVRTPVQTARKRLFQNTPQRVPPLTQPRFQISGAISRVAKAAGLMPPCSPTAAALSTKATGRKTKTSVAPTTKPTERLMKRSPRKIPCPARPSVSWKSRASALRAAPRPKGACPPAWGTMAASQGQAMPAMSSAKPCAASHARPSTAATALAREPMAVLPASRLAISGTSRAPRTGSSQRLRPARLSASAAFQMPSAGKRPDGAYHGRTV